MRKKKNKDFHDGLQIITAVLNVLYALLRLIR